MKKQYILLAIFISIFSFQGYSNSFIERYNSITKSSLTVVPVFGSNASSYCQNSVAQPLPTISLNGISGTWSPSSIDTSLLGTTIYTFTPNIGQDATTASMFITVSPEANAGILSGVQNICVGLTTSFSATIANGIWTSSDTSIASINAVTGVITGQSAGTATMTYTVLGVAPCPNATATRTVSVNSGAALTIFCDPSNVTALNSVAVDWNAISGATNYEYSYYIDSVLAGSGMTSVSHAEIFGISSGQSVTVTLTNAAGVSCFQPTSVTCSNLANTSFDVNAFQSFPNPVSNILNLTSAYPINNVTIINALGQQVLDKAYDSESIQIDMSDLMLGVYMVKIASKNTAKTIKIIKN